jgi:gluconolactonase
VVGKPEMIAIGITVPEGPTWCPDGSLIVTSVAEGAIYRIWPEARRKERIALTQGGANSSALATDGGLLVTQNGGLDFRTLPMMPGSGLEGYPLPGPDRIEAGLQRIRPDGGIERVLGGMQAPNDLAIAADGTVYFTDPHPWPPPADGKAARVMAMARDGTVREVAGGFSMVNGIAAAPDGTLVVTEGNGLIRLSPDGEFEWIIESVSETHATDGIKLDTEGRIYMAASADRGVRIVEDGKVIEHFRFDGEGFTTNLCFGGEDMRTLFVTDGPGQVWMMKDMPSAGLPLHTWPAPD